MLLRNAEMLAGIDLVVKGDGPEDKADSLLASLIEHGLKAFQEVLAGIDNRTTVLLGHTRRRTRGDERINRNKHPIRAGDIIGTHNGTIHNADYLFRRFKLLRFAQVDSELLFRPADRAFRPACRGGHGAGRGGGRSRWSLETHARVQARESHGVLQGVVHLHRPGETGEGALTESRMNRRESPMNPNEPSKENTCLRADTHRQARRTPRARGERRPERPLGARVPVCRVGHGTGRRRASDLRRSRDPPPGHRPPRGLPARRTQSLQACAGDGPHPWRCRSHPALRRCSAFSSGAETSAWLLVQMK